MVKKKKTFYQHNYVYMKFSKKFSLYFSPDHYHPSHFQMYFGHAVEGTGQCPHCESRGGPGAVGWVECLSA